ncbi:CDP-diacylglycerol--glycerol-3-phosphate 3-phosphatidyltransferase [Agromyces flavus]|uniref:CDP-diacylglycerol--glycerol-3-phosphate 3-phosphatidyltransferase n=1 Tax=Agromyces flavus TaxID=589382 RepID=A0A1H1T239_9MICO|nr:CDP-diacylglycerol--glycerol-3-phosphate 3-phosphatidyltransferase [Agromyces flavus]MCP2369250.1 CDP-diacylglycerol--glycerol-3-phosphate 3-phosphatidyltransferase [Agromyces flavus]GGI48776.1 CDP-diacylglycerol--glycerol-3-phosphate 3-phosphatidyltransferase [Agromyces flavus]SDS54327.1 CDP-diacylglycerol--glycerol-3-phosphate 3-phosphatidyltransferase [Agromyces flavus]
MTSPAGRTHSANNWNLPNAITVVRIIMAPVFFWLLLADAGADGPMRWWAAVIFIVAISTDWVDGWLARSRGLVTDVGKILDPIADKLLTSGALVCLSILGELPWWITIVIVVREVGITAWRFVELGRGTVVPASSGGKLKTLTQAIAISLFLTPLWTIVGDWIVWVNWAFMILALVLTVWSGLLYVRDAFRLAREHRSEAA